MAHRSSKQKPDPEKSIPPAREDRLEWDGLIPLERTRLSKKDLGWRGGGKYRRGKTGQQAIGGRSHRPPAWVKDADGFTFLYDRDETSGKILPPTESQQDLIMTMIANYLQRLMVLQFPTFNAGIFQRVFRVSKRGRLPAERTIEALMAEARKSPFGSEFTLIIDILLAMSTGALPGPLAWRSTEWTRWVFDLVYDAAAEKSFPDEDSRDWYRRIHAAFKLDYLDWRWTPQGPRSAKSIPTPGAAKATTQVGDEPKSSAQTFKEYLLKKKPKQRSKKKRGTK